MKFRYWNETEEQILKNNYGKIKLSDMTILFNPPRTRASLNWKAHDLGLKNSALRGTTHKVIIEYELAWGLRHGLHLDNIKIGKLFNIHPHTIGQKFKKLGIPLTIYHTVKCEYCGKKREVTDYRYLQNELNGMEKWFCNRTHMDEYRKENPVAGTGEDNPNWKHDNLLHGKARRMFQHYKKGDEDIGRNFDLTEEQFYEIITKPCVYSGKTKHSNDYNWNDLNEYNGIDRVDNKKGHIKSNCVSCDGDVNKMKGTFSQKEFAQIIVDCYSWANDFLGGVNE